MKKFISYAIPIVTLAVFIFLMLGGTLFKKPLNPSEDVLAFTEVSIQHVKAENWDMLEKDIINIDTAWKKIIPRIQFSVETDEITDLSLNIAKLKASISVEDKISTMIELNEVIENWNELTK